MECLRQIGCEREISAVSGALREHVLSLSPAAVGAYQLYCSDEAEAENHAAFDCEFVDPLLPQLKRQQRSAFRTITLGGRYEVGALGIAEDHFALRVSSPSSFKVVVIKLNSHVAAGADGNNPPSYGQMARYQRDSLACGALYAMLDGANFPAANELAAAFGNERLTALRELSVEEPTTVALRMAVASAVLQTRAIIADIATIQPKSPTLFLIASCVSLNKPGPDRELLVGFTEIDSRKSLEEIKHQGLGAEPHAYRFSFDGQIVQVNE